MEYCAKSELRPVTGRDAEWAKQNGPGGGLILSRRDSRTQPGVLTPGMHPHEPAL